MRQLNFSSLHTKMTFILCFFFRPSFLSTNIICIILFFTKNKNFKTGSVCKYFQKLYCTSNFFHLSKHPIITVTFFTLYMGNWRFPIKKRVLNSFIHFTLHKIFDGIRTNTICWRESQSDGVLPQSALRQSANIGADSSVDGRTLWAERGPTVLPLCDLWPTYSRCDQVVNYWRHNTTCRHCEYCKTTASSKI